jgi:XrtN system VIT domain protein
MVQTLNAPPAVAPLQQTPAQNSTSYRIGLGLLAISALVFALPLITHSVRAGDDALPLFFLNVLITVTYAFLGKNILKGDGSHTKDRFVFLLLFLISAYSLNRALSVFQDSADWLSVLLVVSSIVYLALPYMAGMPQPVRQALAFAIGVATMLWLYLTLYLTPLYIICIVALPALAFSSHAFVPALLLFFTIKWQVYTLRRDRRLAIGFSLGIVISLIVITAFCLQWTRLEKEAARDYQHSLIDDNTDLPSWVKVAMHLPDTWATKPFLKGGLVYTTATNFNGFWSFPSRNLNEIRKHDPLVMIASLFGNSDRISEDDRIKILESKFDLRHNTEERLWSGDHLLTTGIITNAAIWPRQHLAYTEQIITVANNGHDTWSPEEEALYTFRLPEGSAVTSLSLWIDGRESKGILTTKGKADSAYKTIVGKERRDPSVVHWAEGNRVSVRVFPVMPGNNRVFKIGVTTPLIEQAGRLVYEPMQFEGPSAYGALATTQLSIDGPLAGEKGLAGFSKDARGRFKYEGAYDGSWQLSFDAPPLQSEAFSFNGNTYTLQPYTPERIPVITERIYLDLNKSWTRAEFDAVYNMSKGRQLFAYTDDLVPVTEENKDLVFKTADAFDFSLFPLFQIEKPQTALLITKGTTQSPNVKDLTGSAFAEKLDAGLQQNAQYRLYNLGTTLSPYLKTLKEHRAFRYEHGTLDELKSLLAQNVFAAYPENENSIVLDDAGMRITKTAGTTAANGPDHLLRLFAYNHVIQHLGRHLYTNMEGDAALLKEASEAYVVSPVSSLIVLESAADYERFGIKDDGASLKNASVKSHGAVPEPHEWALIILALLVLAWVKFRRQPALNIIRTK